MNPELLRRFNDDKATKESLQMFLVEFFREKIIERAMEKKDVSSLADAIGELERGFEQLAIEYGLPGQTPTQENPAR